MSLTSEVQIAYYPGPVSRTRKGKTFWDWQFHLQVYVAESLCETLGFLPKTGVWIDANDERLLLRPYSGSAFSWGESADSRGLRTANIHIKDAKHAAEWIAPIIRLGKNGFGKVDCKYNVATNDHNRQVLEVFYPKHVPKVRNAARQKRLAEHTDPLEPFYQKIFEGYEPPPSIDVAVIDKAVSGPAANVMIINSDSGDDEVYAVPPGGKLEFIRGALAQFRVRS